MISQFEIYLTVENIYLWSNIGILPFWLLMIFIPNSKFTRVLINSIIAPLLIASAYVYVLYKAMLLDEEVLSIFSLYFDLENLYTIFATESFLLIFWLHFMAINLFLGSWVAIDGAKYSIPKSFTAIILILIYFTGPLGLILYWFIRVFYSKKLGFHD